MPCTHACDDFQRDCPKDEPCEAVRRFTGWNGSLARWRGEPFQPVTLRPEVAQALRAVREGIAAKVGR